MFFSQFVTLDHRTHRAVQNQDALPDDLFDRVWNVGHGLLPEKSHGFYHAINCSLMELRLINTIRMVIVDPSSGISGWVCTTCGSFRSIQWARLFGRSNSTSVST